MDRLLLCLAGDAAAVLAAKDARPALVVLDAEQLVVGGAGDVFGDSVEPLDSFDELVAEDDLVEPVAGEFGLFAREEVVVHRHQRIDGWRDGEDFLGAVGHPFSSDSLLLLRKKRVNLLQQRGLLMIPCGIYAMPSGLLANATTGAVRYPGTRL